MRWENRLGMSPTVFLSILTGFRLTSFDLVRRLSTAGRLEVPPMLLAATKEVVA